MSPPRIRFDEVRRWVFEEACPFWAQAGVDLTHGGFVEHLDLSGHDAGAPFKRTRAQARQVYCFSHLSLMGAPEEARAAAEHGWDFLTRHARRADGGWVRSLDRDGGVLDPTCDAYDMAFVLFAHAWRHRLTGDPAVVESALDTLEALNRLLRASNGPGWLAFEADAGPRQQNPHMHLIEAALELVDTTRAPAFLELAREVALLFRDRLFDPSTGALVEIYASDWSRLPGDEGRSVEPGHHLEWSWILHRAGPRLGLDLSREARALYDFAERWGVHPQSGLAYDEVDEDGRVRRADSRAWPQTERLKGNLAMFEHAGLDTRAQIARTVDNLLDRYLAARPRGSWIDHFAASGQARVDKIPSSTFYHLLLALSELLRLQPQLEAET